MQVLIELDEDTLRRLEKVAPGKSRKRSAFIRSAIQKSLWELEEEKTRRAYLEQPDGESASFDPEAWEPLPYGGFDPPRASVRSEVGRTKAATRRRARTRRPSRK